MSRHSINVGIFLDAGWTKVSEPVIDTFMSVLVILTHFQGHRRFFEITCSFCHFRIRVDRIFCLCYHCGYCDNFFTLFKHTVSPLPWLYCLCAVLDVYKNVVQQCQGHDAPPRSHWQWETAEPRPEWPDSVQTLLQTVWHTLWNADTHWEGKGDGYKHQTMWMSSEICIEWPGMLSSRRCSTELLKYALHDWTCLAVDSVERSLWSMHCMTEHAWQWTV